MKVFDFFSGCGGTSEGLRQAGYEIVFGLDSDKDAIETFRANFPKALAVQTDIRKYSPEELSHIVGERTQKILFCGCAPCQPFSKQNGLKKADDQRLNLLREFQRFVEHWVPDYVLVENVPGLQKVERSPVLKEFKSALEKLGYKHNSGVFRCSDYGVPQKRERFILVAALDSTPKLPLATHGPGKIPYSTVSDWIRDLPEIEHGTVHIEDRDHQSAKLSEKNLRRIKATPEGGDRSSWPVELVLDCHKQHKGHTDVYGRLAWDKPASGLTTRCISYSNGRFGHPTQNRAISLREAALIQTFPKCFLFKGSLSSRARQVGNAVPPLVAKAIGNALLNEK